MPRSGAAVVLDWPRRREVADMATSGDCGIVHCFPESRHRPFVACASHDRRLMDRQVTGAGGREAAGGPIMIPGPNTAGLSLTLSELDAASGGERPQVRPADLRRASEPWQTCSTP